MKHTESSTCNNCSLHVTTYYDDSCPKCKQGTIVSAKDALILDMYEALKQCVAPMVHAGGFADTVSIAYKAIAKAEGRV